MISRQELDELIRHTDGLMLSIYMPVDRPGAEIGQNPIRLKNLIDQAETRLRQKGLQAGEIQDFLAPVRDLLSSMVFWQEQCDGLAIFRSKDRLVTHQAPVRFLEEVYLNRHFYTRPLIELLESGTYYILALSAEKTRLFRATRYDIHEVDLGEAPRSLKEATKYDVAQRDMQFHNETPARSIPGRNAIFFGQGGGEEDDKKNDVLRFFQMVDREVTPQVSETSSPMVLAGLEYMLPIYRGTSRYTHILKEEVKINPDGIAPEELHEMTWRLVEPYFDQARRGAVDGYHIFAGKKQATKDIQQIVPASFVGQVETLLITRDIHTWGTFDSDGLTTELTTERSDSAEDLVDTAVAQTLRSGGTVYCYDPVEMPDGASIAAILRYPLDGWDYKSNK